MPICSRCKHSAPKNEFISKTGNVLKMCSRCRLYGRSRTISYQKSIDEIDQTIERFSKQSQEQVSEPVLEPIPEKLQYVIQEVHSKHKFHECHRCGTEYVRSIFHKKQLDYRQYWCGGCIENNEVDTQCSQCQRYSILSDDYSYCEHCSYNPITKKFEKEAKITIYKYVN
jgi:transcription elongation factor Elf1